MIDIKIVDSLDENFKYDWGVKVINAPLIWNLTKGEGVKVAVIDTGIEEHPDIQNIKETINMFIKNEYIKDNMGHGTHVVGLIGGQKTGVAPNVDLYIAKVLDEKGNGSMASVIDGITFAINYNVDILCMSLGVNRKLPLSLEEKLYHAYEKGITIVCASGNDGIKPPEYPAFYDFVIGVGGVNENLKRAPFSNFGFELDVVAPATNILSTYKDGKYATMNGTSMASAIVTGAIALIKSYYRKNGVELSPDNIKELFKKLDNRKTKEYGWGFLDLAKIFDLD